MLAVTVTSLAGGAVAASGAAPPRTGGGSIGLRLLDVPAIVRHDPRARLYVVDHLAPGTVIHRRMMVSNTTRSAVRVGSYAAAASIAKGSFSGAEGRTRNELSTWTSVQPSSIEIAAGARAVATVTISIPRDAAPGERYGVIWAEARAAAGRRGGITEVSRVGIRMYVSVGPGGPPAADFAIESLTAERSDDGRPEIVARVRNTGGRALDMNGTLRLRDGPGGLSAGPFPADLGTTLAIGDSEPVAITLDRQLPDGPWAAQVVLRSGLLERRAHATVTFPGTKGSSPPYLAIALAVGLLALLALALRARSRRRRRLSRA